MKEKRIKELRNELKYLLDSEIKKENFVRELSMRDTNTILQKAKNMIKIDTYY